MAFRINRSQFVVTRAIISTFGFILPLALGIATGHIIEGVSIAGGAASLGGVGLTFTRHTRIRTLLIASLGVAISAFIGAWTEPIPWLSVLLIGLWGMGTGLLVVISQSAMIIGIQATIALIILTHFTLSPVQALLQALLMLIGALFQTLLSLLPTPQRVGSERTALAAIFQTLADFIEEPAQIGMARSINEALTRAEETIPGVGARSSEARNLRNIFDEAESIWVEITLFTDLLQRLIQNDEQGRLARQISNGIVTLLRDIAHKLEYNLSETIFTPIYENMDAAARTLVHQQSRGDTESISQQFPVHYKALRAHLRKAEKLAGSRARRKRSASIHITAPRRPRLRLRNTLAIFRANITLRSTAFRHAIRLGVVLIIASMLYRFTPLERSYWIPMTALLVLRPDFTTTFSRGVTRLVGTVLGAASAALLLTLAMPSNGTLVLIEAFVTFFAFALLSVNYGLFSFFVTIEVIILLSFVDHHSVEIGFFRVVDTVIGGALALLAYLLWPTWEHQRVAEQLAKRLGTLRRYYVEVMRVYIHPDDYDAIVIQQRRQEARLARTNAEASVEQAQNEPLQYRLDKGLLQGLLASTDQLAKGILSLEAFLLDTSPHTPLPMLNPFMHTIDDALRLLVAAIREERIAAPLPNVSEALSSLKNRRKALRDKEHSASTELNFIIFASKRTITSIDTMQQMLINKYRHEQTPTETDMQAASS